MNQRIKELAEQAKAFIIVPEHAAIGGVSEVSFDKYEDLEKFAALIRADEREACAKVCDDAVGTWNGWPQAKAALTVGAMAIRARGNS